MTKYLLFIAFTVCIIGCKRDDLEVNCGDPYGPSYEPIYIRLVDNGGANLLGTANYKVEDMEARQTCSDAPLSEISLKKGLIDGNTDSTTFLRIALARDYNGSSCSEFTLKWNSTETSTFSVAFRDSIVTGSNGCKSYYYFPYINENSSVVPQNKNMKTDNSWYNIGNGYTSYYTITK